MSVFSRAARQRRASSLLMLILLSLLAVLHIEWQSSGSKVHAQGLPRGGDSLFSAPKFLPVDDAFSFYTSLPEEGVVVVHWAIAPTYYLYREKFGFSLRSNEGVVHAATPQLPDGVAHHDEFFGDVEVYHNQVAARLQIPENLQGHSLKLVIEYQGCSELGLCYTPQQREVELNL